MNKLRALGLLLLMVALLVGSGTTVLAREPGGVSLDRPTLVRVAQVLGVTPDELQTRLSSGETLAKVAASKKVAESQVVEAIVLPYREELQLRLKYSYVTQQQADNLLKEARDRATALLNQNLSTQGGNGSDWEGMAEACNDMMGGSSWGGMMGGPGGYGSGGMMGGGSGGMMGGSGGYGSGGMMGGYGSGGMMGNGWSNYRNTPDSATYRAPRGASPSMFDRAWDGVRGGFGSLMSNVWGGFRGFGGGMMGGR